MNRFLLVRDLAELAVRQVTTNETKPDYTLSGLPPGVTPNFIDPPTRGILMVGVSISMVLLSTFVVLGRAYTKAFVTKSFDWSDYFAFGALVHVLQLVLHAIS
jgi:hypothetical protein